MGKQQPKTLKEAKAIIKQKDIDIKKITTTAKALTEETAKRQKHMDDMDAQVKAITKSLDELQKAIPEDAMEKLAVIKALNMDDLKFIQDKMLSGGTERTFEIYNKMNIPEGSD